MRMDENTNPEWKRLLRGTSSGRRALEIIDGLEAKNKRLRDALQQVWDCEEPNACPDCKLLAREVLKEVE